MAEVRVLRGCVPLKAATAAAAGSDAAAGVSAAPGGPDRRSWRHKGRGHREVSHKNLIGINGNVELPGGCGWVRFNLGPIRDLGRTSIVCLTWSY